MNNVTNIADHETRRAERAAETERALRARLDEFPNPLRASSLRLMRRWLVVAPSVDAAARSEALAIAGAASVHAALMS